MLMAVPSLADGKGTHHGHDPEKKLEQLTKRLGLSPEQQSKVKTILQEKHQKIEELHKQIQEVRKQARSQIEAQLTPEQAEKFKKRQGKGGHGKKKGKGRHGKNHKNKHQQQNGEQDDED
ncbi:MAG: periplasmic heavy metal sensor [Nitrospirales bacterium]|nr:periplasmic heavy metal sensor [Nitrospirales bacterium]